MEQCIESLLPGGEQVEIVIVNDGSADRTGEVADRYACKYPDLVRVIHQENRGHGGAVNAAAAGLESWYFMVVDSDDSLDYTAYRRLLALLSACVLKKKLPDVIFTDYRNVTPSDQNGKVISYANYMPERRLFTADQIRNMPVGTYLFIHSMICRTKFYQETGIALPEKRYYEDQIFVCGSLMHAKTLYYLKTTLYRYLTGRKGQSVDLEMISAHSEDQLYIARYLARMILSPNVPDNGSRRYLKRHYNIVYCVSCVVLMLKGDRDSLRQRDRLNRYLRKLDKDFYRSQRYSVTGRLVNAPGRAGSVLARISYFVAHHFFKVT